MKKLNIGFYLDLFSIDHNDWLKEVIYNKNLFPDFLDIMLEIPGSVKYLEKKSISYLKSIIGKTPISVHAPTIGLSLVSLNNHIIKATQNELLACLDICKLLGSKLMTIHGGEYPYYIYLNNTSPNIQFINNIKPIINKANNLKISVCIENLKNKNIYPQTFEELDYIYSHYPEIMMALDIRHFQINNISSMSAFLRYKNRIKSIHYRVDNGLSDLQLKDFLSCLLREKYKGYFVIEDQALNISNKNNKDMLIKGLKKVKKILENI